jgi:hypothetical protein
MRYTKTYGWQPTPRLYYGSNHWIDGIDQGPRANLGIGSSTNWWAFPYHVAALDLRPIPWEEWSPVTPDIPIENKRIEMKLSTQVLTAFENEQIMLQTNISSGVAGLGRVKGLPTKTPAGEFRILEKYPSKHMGNGNLFASPEDYELPGVPWTSFFLETGYAFHGTYWHDNFGTPMSRGCVNMRIEEAKWLFLWARPLRDSQKISTHGAGTRVVITS